jgi:hypothetical protein
MLSLAAVLVDQTRQIAGSECYRDRKHNDHDRTQPKLKCGKIERCLFPLL